MGVGDLLNVGHPVIVVVSGCGWLNILNVHGVPSDVTTEQELKYDFFSQHQQLRLPTSLGHFTLREFPPM